MKTRLLPTDTPAAFDAAVAEAVACLRAGDPVALPTETVYGLAANALRPEAVLKIFEAKERPFFDPLICHLPDRAWLERVADIPPDSRGLVDALIARFWPGPLTLVLARREAPGGKRSVAPEAQTADPGTDGAVPSSEPVVPDIVTAGLPTVAVRMSAHPVFGAVCAAFGSPLAAPSANQFGRISPTAAAHVRSELDGRIPLILDGGATKHGLESTIVKVEVERLQILRAGPVTVEDLAQVWKDWCDARGHVPDEAEVTRMFADLGVDFPAMLRGQKAAVVEAPGQLKSHYAPRTPLRIFEIGTHFRAYGSGPKIGSLAFSQASPAGEFACEEILSPTGDLREAAATLFAKMRRLDEAGLDLILAEPVPEHGLGIAIMDRLRKAAAEHEQ